MCGIGGVIYANTKRLVAPSTLKAMGDAIAHRGPDAEGFWIGAGVGLGHRRLSIIDLAGGDQPMGNEDGSIQVVFNGEIYNFQQLRNELLAKGHRFRTRSDTEVLVHLYEEAGEQLVERLRGMFAFAIWDGRSRKLLLARDRVGLKPLYYYRDSEKMLFGSEIKAILAHPDVDRTIDPVAIEDYLAYGMIPGEHSIFRNVRKLPPGHTLVVDQDAFSCHSRRYWQLQTEVDDGRTLEDWLDALEDKITETIKAHMIADVPVGAFLSGGLDSSLVVAAVSEAGGEPVQTFSIGFHEKKFSELPYAREVAARFGTKHVEEFVTPKAAESVERLVRFYDEPFADSSAIPTMCVSEVARRHVKVVLSGDGGDEAFGGYSRYAHDLGEAAVRRWIPRWMRRCLLAPIARGWPKADWLPRVLRAKTTLTNLSLDPASAYARSLAICSPEIRRRLMAADVWARLDGYRPEDIVRQSYGDVNGDALRGMIAADVAMLLPDDFLTKVDRASMAVGLEVRPPFVDHEFLELASRIPSKWKIRNGQKKWILKQLVQDRLPDSVVWRRKQGFEIPVDQWLREPLRELFEESVLSRSSPVATYINQRTAAELYRQHRARTGRHGSLLWALLVLGCWMKQYEGPVGASQANAVGV